jgi:hypothetical protein
VRARQIATWLVTLVNLWRRLPAHKERSQLPKMVILKPRRAQTVPVLPWLFVCALNSALANKRRRRIAGINAITKEGAGALVVQNDPFSQRPADYWSLAEFRRENPENPPTCRAGTLDDFYWQERSYARDAATLTGGIAWSKYKMDFDPVQIRLDGRVRFLKLAAPTLAMGVMLPLYRPNQTKCAAPCTWLHISPRKKYGQGWVRRPRSACMRRIPAGAVPIARPTATAIDDEALEASAGGMKDKAGTSTLAFCSGLDTCPA